MVSAEAGLRSYAQANEVVEERYICKAGPYWRRQQPLILGFHKITVSYHRPHGVPLRRLNTIYLLPRHVPRGPVEQQPPNFE